MTGPSIPVTPPWEWDNSKLVVDFVTLDVIAIVRSPLVGVEQRPLDGTCAEWAKHSALDALPARLDRRAAVHRIDLQGRPEEAERNDNAENALW